MQYSLIEEYQHLKVIAMTHESYKPAAKLGEDERFHEGQCRHEDNQAIWERCYESGQIREKIWFSKHGLLHCEDDQPVRELYYENGHLRQENGIKKAGFTARPINQP